MPKNLRSLARFARIALVLTGFGVALAGQTGDGLAATRAAKPRKATHAAHRNRPTKRAHALGSVPAQGIFDSCDLSSALTTCEQDLLQMHQAGLQVAVVSAEWDSLTSLSSYAAYAQSIGMSVMWELNDPGFWGGAWIGANAAGDWSSFSTACGCTETAQVLSYMIHWLAALPATYGYYAADDSTLEPGQITGLRQYVDAIKAADATHMVMVGSSQGQGTTYYSTGATVGNEIYPETTNSLMPYANNLAVWQSVQQSVAQDQRAANTAGTPSAFILQAFSFGDNLSDGEAVGACTPDMTPAECANRVQYPSAGVQLELRNQTLENAQPKLILWYTYSQAAGHWSDLTNVVHAPYPATASAARSHRAHRAPGKRA